MKNGFTFIEILITLAVIAIAFLPLIQMYTSGLEHTYELSDLSTARYLAQEGMERTKNLGFTQAQMEGDGDAWYPSLDKPPLLLNDRLWRVERKVLRTTDPLEIHILVHKIDKKMGRIQENKPAVELVALMEDLDWAAA